MNDNRIGGLAFLLTRVARRVRPIRRRLLAKPSGSRPAPDATTLSGVLWDMFSGSAPYGDIFRRMFSPGLIARLVLAAPVRPAAGPATGRTEVEA